MRITTITITNEDYTRLAHSIDQAVVRAVMQSYEDDDKQTRRRLAGHNASESVQQAVGRLAMWAMPNPGGGDGYTHCAIHCASTGERDQPEIVGVYTDERNPAKRYVIGAIWHGTSWGFHS